MTAETDLLPLPAYDIDTVNHASVRLRGYTGDRTRAYAHACVSSATEALRAEVERLQGEVDDLGEQLVDDAARANDERSYWYIVKDTKAQNERLAEALRWRAIESLPDDETIILAKTDDGRVMIYRGSILARNLRGPTPEHLKFPAVKWMHIPGDNA